MLSADRDPTITDRSSPGADGPVLSTDDGVEFLRTPDTCFEGLPGWPYAARHVEIDGLQQAYVDEGPADADPILLLHGQPSWSYLYRRMIPALVGAGHRVIAMDHLGMGRSDKPIDTGHYSFDLHADRLQRFMAALDLRGVTLFGQDWGSIIGLWQAASDPGSFDRIAIGNGGMPANPPSFELPEADDPAIAAFADTLASMPPDQPPFFAEDGTPLLPMFDAVADDDGNIPDAVAGLLFSQWAGYAYHCESFRPSLMVEALTFRALADDVRAAYDAPFPSRDHLAAPRTFPRLLNDLVGRTVGKKSALTRYERPFLTLFGGNDPGLVGEADDQAWMVENIPGAAGQPHHRYRDASHFLQEDQGEDIARRLIAFIAGSRP
jgi:haloalkane dehalogenase